MATKFILDSGIVEEYKELIQIASSVGSEIWGATTNPSLIAKNFSDKKVTPDEAEKLHKDVILQLVELVPGAVSAEVYADHDTTAKQMVEQGIQIATWHPRVVVKLPTTIEGFKARTILRKKRINTNNTLVFSQQQIFAICLHEHLLQTTENVAPPEYPPFISPFVGRLDDKGINGMDLVQHGMELKKLFTTQVWMLEASVRTLEHFNKGLEFGSELITAPLKIYKDYFSQNSTSNGSETQKNTLENIKPWQPEADLVECPTIEDFMSTLSNGRLDITHELTNAGIDRFVSDWKAIIA